MRNYNLGFISDELIFNHVKATMLQYSRKIDLKSFNKNIIDPIKLTFDSKIYGQTIEEAITAECMRQIDIAKRSGNDTWNITIDENGRKRQYANNRIRKVSIDKFYEIVYNDKHAFLKLCKALPMILDDVLEEEPSAKLVNTVYDELDKTDFYKSLYLLAFSTYEGFNEF